MWPNFNLDTQFLGDGIVSYVPGGTGRGWRSGGPPEYKLMRNTAWCNPAVSDT